MQVSRYEIQKRACQIGIKALQNIYAAHQAFVRLNSLESSKDTILRTAFFHYGIIRYVKPFINSDTGHGRIRYPIRQIKDTPNFSDTLHAHLIDLRNTIIAHDDFSTIEPKLLISFFVIEEKYSIPTSVDISNRCIAFPEDKESLAHMVAHIEATHTGIANKLFDDVLKLRQFHIDNPDEIPPAVDTWEVANGTFSDGGGEMKLPSNANHPWLNPDALDFGEIKTKYAYDVFKVTRTFPGPERIVFPDGNWIELTPKEPNTPLR